MNLELTPEERAFQAEVRDFLEQSLTPELRLAGRRTTSVFSDKDDNLAWQKILHTKGWVAPAWPAKYGGTGWNEMQRYIFAAECARAGAPSLSPMGLKMVGPVIMGYGTEEQKAFYLPRILAGEDYWCQGYSEPGAGSDLASLQTRAEDKGDHYLVNGQKVWTSYADQADWIFCLVRTDTTVKHEGISFLLFDMTTQGVEPRPIKLISGESSFCETFFTDVKVPKAQLVGKLNGGWEIAKRLLQYERQNISSSGFGGAAGLELEQVALSHVGEVDGKIADGDLRARIAGHKMDAKAFALTVRRVEAESKAGGTISPATSIIKYAAAKLNQDKYELLVESMGHQGLGWEGEGFTKRELIETRGWLRSKGNSIEGGTSEINLNVVAKRVLGLLDHQ